MRPLLLAPEGQRVGQELLKELWGLLRRVLQIESFLFRHAQVVPEPFHVIQDLAPKGGRRLDQMIENQVQECRVENPGSRPRSGTKDDKCDERSPDKEQWKTKVDRYNLKSIK